MNIALDILDHNAPRLLAEKLGEMRAGDSATISLGDVDLCPNRIVPIVGIVDTYLSKGYSVRFDYAPHSIAERVLGAVNARTLNPSGDILAAFGRVWRFDNAREQTELVNAMVLELDKSTRLARGVKQCFEWCLNEVTDNVLNHSRPSGDAHGYVMVQHIPQDNRLKICVFDTGIGLMKSFEGSRYNPKTSSEAIRLSVGKGVTNGKGQGNGLWGLHEMVKLSKRGKLHIRSAGAEYLFDPMREIESDRETWTLPGLMDTTTVDFQMVCSEPTTLQDIFGSDYITVDLWQEERELADGKLLLKVSELAEGFGSRESARKVRNLVENAIENDRRFVVLDFAGVDMCSSSFIDELVAKLIVKYGVLTYGSRFMLDHLSGLTQGLANLSVSQRLAQEGTVGL